MAYIVNPSDSTHPADTDPAMVAAAELRALKGLIAGLTGLPSNFNFWQGFRNKLINGAFLFDQEWAGAGASATSTTPVFPADQWGIIGQAADGVFSGQNVADAPPKFKSSHKLTVITADAAIGATQFYLFQQRVEGNDIYDLAYGTVDAETTTLSFRVKASIAGTYGGSLGNNVDTCYPFSFTVTAPNVWETKTITIPGCTTGVWHTDNTLGALLTFDIGCGASLKGTANQWSVGTYYYGATGATNLIATLGATLQFAGVQWEKGTIATPFEVLPPEIGFVRCQRYYWKDATIICQGYNAGGSLTFHRISCPIEMRIAPAVGNVSISTLVNSNATTPVYDLGTTKHIRLAMTITATGSGYGVINIAVNTRL